MTNSSYQAAISAAIVADLSSNGKVVVTGTEAPQFLHNLCTNDVQSMPLGAGCEAFFCNVRARALFLTHIYHLRLGGQDALWIDVTPGYSQKLLDHLNRHWISEQIEMADRTSDFAQLHVAGPQANAVLSRAIGESMPDLALHQHMERSIAGIGVHIRRNDPFGVPGYDVVCLAARKDELWNQLVAAGAMPASADVCETLRLEAGTPVYGVDIDENRFVMEVGRTDAVSFSKGCYLGQEPIVMARDRAGFLSRYFRGLRLPAIIAPGTKLFTDAEAGVVTSAVESPRFGPIGLGYVRRGQETSGTKLHIDSSSGQSAIVATLPFNSGV